MESIGFILFTRQILAHEIIPFFYDVEIGGVLQQNVGFVDFRIYSPYNNKCKA